MVRPAFLAYCAASPRRPAWYISAETWRSLCALLISSVTMS